MDTFHVIGKLNLTILVGDFGIVELIKNVLCALFEFRRGFVHVSKDFATWKTYCFKFYLLSYIC